MYKELPKRVLTIPRFLQCFAVFPAMFNVQGTTKGKTFEGISFAEENFRGGKFRGEKLTQGKAYAEKRSRGERFPRRKASKVSKVFPFRVSWCPCTLNIAGNTEIRCKKGGTLRTFFGSALYIYLVYVQVAYKCL